MSIQEQVAKSITDGVARGHYAVVKMLSELLPFEEVQGPLQANLVIEKNQIPDNSLNGKAVRIVGTVPVTNPLGAAASGTLSYGNVVVKSSDTQVAKLTGNNLELSTALNLPDGTHYVELSKRSDTVGITNREKLGEVDYVRLTAVIDQTDILVDTDMTLGFFRGVEWTIQSGGPAAVSLSINGPTQVMTFTKFGEDFSAVKVGDFVRLSYRATSPSTGEGAIGKYGTYYAVTKKQYSGLELSPIPYRKEEVGLYEPDSGFKVQKFFGNFNYEIFRTRRNIVALRGSKNNFGLVRPDVEVASGKASSPAPGRLRLEAGTSIEAGIAPGDRLDFGSLGSVLVVSTEGPYLVVSPEISFTDTRPWTAHRRSDWLHASFRNEEGIEQTLVLRVREVINDNLVQLDPEVYSSTHGSAPYYQTLDRLNVEPYWSRKLSDVLISRATPGKMREFFIEYPSGDASGLAGKIVFLKSFSGIENTSDEGLTLSGYYHVESASGTRAKLAPLRYEESVRGSLAPQNKVYKNLEDVFSLDIFGYRSYFPYVGFFKLNSSTGLKANLDPVFLTRTGEGNVGSFVASPVKNPITQEIETKIPDGFSDNYDVRVFTDYGAKFFFYSPSSNLSALQEKDYLVPSSHQRGIGDIVRVSAVLNASLVFLEKQYYDSLNGLPAFYPSNTPPSRNTNLSVSVSSVRPTLQFNSLELSGDESLSSLRSGDKILLAQPFPGSAATASLFKNWWVVEGGSGQSVTLKKTAQAEGILLENGSTGTERTGPERLIAQDEFTALDLSTFISHIIHEPEATTAMRLVFSSAAPDVVLGEQAISGAEVTGHVFRFTVDGQEYQRIAKTETEASLGLDLRPVTGSNGAYAITDQKTTLEPRSLHVEVTIHHPKAQKKNMTLMAEEFVRQLDTASSALTSEVLAFFTGKNVQTIFKAVQAAIQDIKAAAGNVKGPTIEIDPNTGFKGENASQREYTMDEIIDMLGSPDFSPSSYKADLYETILHKKFLPALQVYFNVPLADELAKLTMQEKKNVYVQAYLEDIGYQDAIAWLQEQKNNQTALLEAADEVQANSLKSAIAASTDTIESYRAQQATAVRLKDQARVAITQIRERPDLMSLIDEQLATLTGVLGNFLAKGALYPRRVFVMKDGPFNPAHLQTFLAIIAAISGTGAGRYLGFKKNKLGLIASSMRPGVEPSVRRSSLSELVETEKEPTLKNKARRLVRVRNRLGHSSRQLADLQRHHDSAVNPEIKKTLADAISQLFPRVQMLDNATKFLTQQLAKVKEPEPPKVPTVPPNDGTQVSAATDDAVPGEPQTNTTTYQDVAYSASRDDGPAQPQLREAVAKQDQAKIPTIQTGTISNLFDKDFNDFKSSGIVVPFAILNQSSGQNKGNLSYITLVADPDVSSSVKPKGDGHHEEEVVERNIQFRVGGLNFDSSQYNQFILTGIQENYQEKAQVMDTLGSGWTAFFFGSHPEVWSVSGLLINDMASDHVTKFRALWQEYLRGTALATKKMKMKLHIPAAGIAIKGYGLNLSMSIDSQANEALVPFTLQFLVAGHPELIPLMGHLRKSKPEAASSISRFTSSVAPKGSGTKPTGAPTLASPRAPIGPNPNPVSMAGEQPVSTSQAESPLPQPEKGAPGAPAGQPEAANKPGYSYPMVPGQLPSGRPAQP